jgi:signal transduction histidine kinase
MIGSMVRKKSLFSLPIGLTLLVFVLFLSILPLTLIQTVLFQNARKNVEDYAITFTESLLLNIHEYFDYHFLHAESFISRFRESSFQALIDSRAANNQSLNQENFLDFEFLSLDEIILYRLQGPAPQGLRIKPNEFTVPLEPEDIIPVDTIEVLRENKGRVFWQGSLSFFPMAKNTLWAVSIQEVNEMDYLLAVGIKPEVILQTLRNQQIRTDSQIFLITQDNSVFTSAPVNFFNQTYSSIALGRTIQGEYTHFIHREYESELLIQVYSHPSYFYNIVSVKDREKLISPLMTGVNQSTLVLLISSFSISLLAGLFIFFLSQKLNSILEAIQKLSFGNYTQAGLAKTPIGITEMDDIYEGVTNMASTLQSREKELQKAKSQLESQVIDRTMALNESETNLEKVQKSLLQSEKMAALGRAMAGFTHEVNNPLSIGISAASLLESLASELVTDKGIQATHPSQLQTIKETTDLLVKNLQHAADITNSIKNIAMDQVIDDVRMYNLLTYLKEIVFSLSPKIGRREISIKVFGDEELNLYGAPSIHYQIFSNLILNSLKHAYGPQEKGEIHISAQRFQKGKEDWIQIHYQDFGRGMDSEQLEKIYEPFFTNSKEGGGTGLGMSVVYNLVNRSLRGDIYCQSVQGKGSEFFITFPESFYMQKVINQEANP